ncbi:DNA cytosine methyltransferase [Cupriavidus sp. YAF13]|uniref:DNA cytosine methyltransferase n=1 Tax=Cupriavidus sp. YAF13 TaxID=3233075 RepID=UPI003F8F380C
MTAIRFGSVCSGIEAASVAWRPLGWRAAWLAEIEPFPSAVLAHHYPNVRNLGDMTKLARMVLAGEIEAPDVLVGGTPCQAYSVAGMRAGLNDARGQLTLRYMELADAIDFVRTRDGKPPCVIVWENVPGVLSDKTNAFGCFLAGLAGEDVELRPAGKRWTNAGCVFGPQRAIAWRTLDAQYFGLAQRRRRVFVIASARNGFDPSQVLFEWDGLRRDSAPSRVAGEDTAAGTLRSTDGGSDVDHASASHLIAGTLQAAGKAACSATQPDAEARLLVAAYGGNNTSGPIDVATARNACASASGRLDFETETFITQCVTSDITHALKAEGADASEDGMGSGNPIIPVAIQAGALRVNPASGPDGVGVQEHIAYTLEARAEVQAVAFDTTQITSRVNRSNPKPGDACHPLAAGAHAPAIAFDCKASGQSGFGVGEIAATLRSMGHADSHQNGGGHASVLHAMRVRRLTPRECERLQGFPDDYTLIPFGRAVRPEKLDEDWIKYLLRGGVMTREQVAQAAADGPRYKALGNSMAETVMTWIGRRIDDAIRRSAC